MLVHQVISGTQERDYLIYYFKFESVSIRNLVGVQLCEDMHDAPVYNPTSMIRPLMN